MKHLQIVTLSKKITCIIVLVQWKNGAESLSELYLSYYIDLFHSTHLVCAKKFHPSTFCHLSTARLPWWKARQGSPRHLDGQQSVWQPPPPSDPNYHQAVISWLLCSSLYPIVQDMTTNILKNKQLIINLWPKCFGAQYPHEKSFAQTGCLSRRVDHKCPVTTHYPGCDQKGHPYHSHQIYVIACMCVSPSAELCSSQVRPAPGPHTETPKRLGFMNCCSLHRQQ